MGINDPQSDRLRTEALRVGECRLDTIIHQGESTMLYRGRHLNLGVDVVARLLAADLAADDDVVRLFEAEALAASKVEYPHIVAPIDHGDDGGGAYVIYPWIDGLDLHAQVAREGPLAWPEACRILSAIARALDHIHALGLVHRKVKSSNVVVGVNSQPWLADLGPVVNPSRIGRGGPPSTSPYVAPEVKAGGAPDPRSDLFGLGVILYESLVGAIPAGPDDTLPEIDGHLTDSALPPLGEAVPGIPRALESLATSLCASEPARRPVSGAAVAAIMDVLSRSPDAKNAKAAPRPTPPPEAVTAEPDPDDDPEATTVTRRYGPPPSVAGVVLPDPPPPRPAAARPSEARRAPTPPSAAPTAPAAIGPGPAVRERGTPTDTLGPAKVRAQVAELLAEAGVQRGLGNNDGAIELIERALKLDPDHEEAQSALGRTREGIDAEARYQDERERATRFAGEGDHLSALAALDAAADALRSCVDTKRRNAEIKAERERITALAEVIATVEMKLGEDDVEAILEAASAADALAAEHGGDAAVQAAVDVARRTVAARRVQVATDALDSASVEAFFEHVERALELAPDHLGLKSLLERAAERAADIRGAVAEARTAFQTGKTKEALAALRRASDHAPEDQRLRGVADEVAAFAKELRELEEQAASLKSSGNRAAAARAFEVLFMLGPGGDEERERALAGMGDI